MICIYVVLLYNHLPVLSIREILHLTFLSFRISASVFTDQFLAGHACIALSNTSGTSDFTASSNDSLTDIWTLKAIDNILINTIYSNSQCGMHERVTVRLI